MKEKLKNYLESIRKDKKKGLIAFGLVVGLIGTIVIGIVTASGKSNEEDLNSKQVSSLDVPVDTMSINNKRSKGATGGSGDFFGENQNDQPGPDEKVEEPVNTGHKSTTTANRNYSYSYTPRSYQTSNSNVQKSNVVENTPTVTETSKEKRKRVPSDGAGNMAGTGKMTKGSVANGDKTVKNGSYVKIRIAEDMIVQGMKIPKNTVVTGVAKSSQERMMINITSVKIGTITKSVDWTIYDEDGNEGIAIPANILNDIAKDAGGDAVEKGGSSVETNVPIVGSVKVNLKKKTQEISFVLRDGHRVYIKEVK